MEVGDLQLTITESTLATATDLPQKGEHWFKNKTVEDQEWRNMLKNPGMDTSIFTKGIPVRVIKEEWTSLLLLVQDFLTCEGRFGVMYIYHTRIMMHFMDDRAINLPCFLLASLKKMSATVQKHVGNIEPHLYHHGLIRILIEEQLKTKNDTWEKFLVRNHFQEVAEASSSSPRIPKRSRRRGKEITAQETAVEIEETAQETAEETAQEIAQEERKKGDRTKRQKGDKGKAIVQESFPSPEPSIEEESQTLADRLAQLQATALLKRKQQEKHSAQQKSTNVQVRRSSRLKGKMSVTKGKQSHFIERKRLQCS